MKQNTEQLKKEIADILRTNDVEGIEDFRQYLAQLIVESIQPHLISSDEIKREAVKKDLRELVIWIGNTYKMPKSLSGMVEQYIELYVDKDGDHCAICNRLCNKFVSDGICKECL